MKVNDDVFERIVESVKQALQLFHSHKRRPRVYAKGFLNRYNDVDREFILKEILHNQNKSIAKAISEKKNIAIPSLGSFQYRESLELIKEITTEVKKEYNVTNIKECDPDKASVVIDEINKRKKLVILPLYFKQLGGKGSTVDHNFLNKK